MIVPAVLFLGIFLAIVAIRGTHGDFFELVKGDFSGTNSFVPWIASLTFLWFIGFIPGFRPVSRGLMVLVLVTLFLKRGTGFFDQLNKQLGIT
jgi:hypothetical protein